MTDPMEITAAQHLTDRSDSVASESAASKSASDTPDLYAGRLTTHVLDLSRGKPAAGVAVELRRREEDGAWTLLGSASTNGDGRLDAPLLEGPGLTAGCYELLFRAGDYWRGTEAAQAGTLEVEADRAFFLEEVPIRFRVTDPTEHYHVPLLLAPGGYSTYRGS